MEAGAVEVARSWALGTLPLWVTLAVAVVVARRRPLGSPDAVRTAGVVGAGAAGVVLQTAHAAEELLTGFPARFSTLLGLAPWSPEAFAAFNLAWLAVWTLCLVALARRGAAPAWPLWFLAMAQVLNLAAHPLLALAVGGYFPGLVTAPAVGATGIVLARRLLRAGPTASSAPPASG
jgi:hypothetical protein